MVVFQRFVAVAVAVVAAAEADAVSVDFRRRALNASLLVSEKRRRVCEGVSWLSF